MNGQHIKSFFITLGACFVGSYLALVVFNTRFDFGKIFLPAPAKPVEVGPQQVPPPPGVPMSQGQQDRREQYKLACKEEIINSCSKDGIENVITCLLDLESVSPNCKNSLSVFTERWKPCESDIRNLCPGLKLGGGRISECLKKNKNRISSSACLQIISN